MASHWVHTLAAACLLATTAFAARAKDDRLFLGLPSGSSEGKDRDELHSTEPLLRRRSRRKRDREHQDQRLYLSVSEHHPCDIDGMKIEFGSIEDAPLYEDEKRPGCYMIGSRVEVYSDLGPDLQMYVENTQTLEQEMPNDCEDYNDKQCGGTGGSCLHCKNCTHIELHENEIKNDFSFSLTVDGREPSCSENLEEGTHDNIALRFCLPTRDEYLESQGYNPETFNKILEATSESDVDVYLRLYIFDYDVTSALKSTRALVNILRTAQHLPPDEPVPRGYWLNHTPFGRLIRDEKFVGCHLLVGKVGMREIGSGSSSDESK